MTDLAAEAREALADVRKRAGTTTCWAGLPPSWRLFTEAIDRAGSAVDALSARLAQAEQERDELRDFFRDVFDGDPQAFVEGFNDLDEQIRGAEARLREYEEALNLIATGGYGDASIKARIALVSGDTDG